MFHYADVVYTCVLCASCSNSQCCILQDLQFVNAGGVERGMRGLALGFTNPVATGGVLDVCLCFGCGGVGGVVREWVVAWSRVWRGGVVLCLCELRVWIICADDRSSYLCIVLGGYLRI